MVQNLSRRQFLEFMGRTSMAGLALPYLSGCQIPGSRPIAPLFPPVRPTAKDDLILAEGLKYEVLLSYGDKINSRGEQFGFNCDYTAYIPFDEKNPDEGWLWVNHEYYESIFVSGWKKGMKRTRAQVRKEMLSVGGSIVHIKNTPAGWRFVPNSKHNRRLTALTEIPLISSRPIDGKKTAIGTLANCAGGLTPWKTFLTCEENYNNFFGEYEYSDDGSRKWVPGWAYGGWREFYEHSPELYGWVVEVNPRTGSAKKLTALGRFARECATTIVAKDGRCVVYSGDDKPDECVYKFIAAKPGSLETGELFVADTVNGRWLSLDINKDDRLKKKFKDQTEALIRTREAARVVGATLLDRPEDVEIDPVTGAVLVSLSNNKARGNLHGSILRIKEDNDDHLSMTFKADTFLAGGEKTGFSCPDNMAFDKRGNLWLCCDISDSALNKGPYKSFGNNGLYYIPMSGPDAGKVMQIASGPVNAEFTGPTFSPDGRTLFLSVQHPGEGTTDLTQPLSRWPNGGASLPKPSVVTISGPLLDRLNAAPKP